MANVKGSTLIPRLEYVKKNGAQDVWPKIYQGLRPEFVKEIEKGILVNRWYPMEDYLAYSRRVDEVMGRGDGKLVWELGRFSAEYAARGIYKMFYKMGSPEWVVKMTASVWKQYYDTGVATVVTETVPVGKRIRLCISEMPGSTETLWVSIGGWAEKSIEMSGGKNVKSLVAARRVRPESNFEIELSWA